MPEAEYESKCPACGEEIEPGDPIVYDEDAEDWVHERCQQGETGL